MKKMMFVALFGVAMLATSCDKEGGICLCDYKIGDLSMENQEVNLEGTDATCAEWEEKLSGEYSDVKCRPNN